MNNCYYDNFFIKINVDTIRFWAQNSYEHIDVLLNAYKGTEAVLYSEFEQELKELNKRFRYIYEKSLCIRTYNEFCTYLNKFLCINEHFVKLLERLKFEGFNGYPELYLSVYHFLYEQKYIVEIFKHIEYSKIYSNSVLITAEFKRKGLGCNVCECIYNQMYFWSLIGAQHPNLLLSTFSKDCLPPHMTREYLTEISNKFNCINYNLSRLYNNNLLKCDLKELFEDFEEVNSQFLCILKDFNRDASCYLPYDMKCHMPKLFFGVWKHIVEEHEYVKKLCCNLSRCFC